MCLAVVKPAFLKSGHIICRYIMLTTKLLKEKDPEAKDDHEHSIVDDSHAVYNL